MTREPPPPTPEDAARQERLRELTGGPLVLAPARARAFVRSSELGLILIASLVGAVSGAVVTGIAVLTQGMHEFFFGLEPGARLSAATGLPAAAAFALPALGGLLLGLVVYASGRWRQRNPVDPIEANALHGGRMSLSDSVLVTVQNVISNGFGGSVGLEAGYTQISAAIASRLGLSLEMRRADLRTLVGCGAAAAIATAFNAPLTGAFYAFELIIGVYSVATLTPVIASSLLGSVVARLLVGHAHLIEIGAQGRLGDRTFAAAALLGLGCALFAIALMVGVSWVERLMRRVPVPAWLRPALGGLAVGGLALLTPQVLSAGHGAFQRDLAEALSPHMLITLVLMKACASALCLGSGFRGGLFFAALFLGALLGKLFGMVAAPWLGVAADPTLFALVGMSALAVAIVGGPMTMTFLALEMTADFQLTVLVLVSVIVSALVVRKTFGYSFATWRFHLRGETIRSAHDVGWIRSLTVGQMMRPDIRTIRGDATIATLRREFPPGSAQRAVVVDDLGRYAGVVLVPEAHAPALDGKTDQKLTELLRYRDAVLLPAMSVKEAMAVFDASESEALAVVDGRDARRVVGLLTESHALRRYSEELDRRRKDILGEA